MRGKPDYQSQVYYAIDIESWIEPDHPLRAVKRRADEVLSSMRKDFDRAYSRMGRPSIPPEMLLKALLLQALYTIRSERQLVEQIQMNLLYRWFIDLSLDAPSTAPTPWKHLGHACCFRWRGRASTWTGFAHYATAFGEESRGRWRRCRRTSSLGRTGGSCLRITDRTSEITCRSVR